MSDVTRFSQPVGYILHLSQQKATQLNHALIEPEHILLGLLASQTTAYRILFVMGISLTSIYNLIERDLKVPAANPFEQIELSPRTHRILEAAAREAQSGGYDLVQSSHLLLALMSEPGLARDALQAAGASVEAVRGQMPHFPHEVPLSTQEPPQTPDPLVGATPSQESFTLSPIFLVLVGVTILAGIGAYFELLYAPLMVVLFVIGGWVITLSLHEFGHALTAYWAGDKSVVSKGYLTLNPVKYTHLMTSIIFPIIILFMGGIGLPGGAVYINLAAIRQKWQRSLVSAAGPLATLMCAVALLTPFVMRLVSAETEHFHFWAGVAFLAFLQITAFLFNLLPLPGLDGFGIIAPFLPPGILKVAYRSSGFSFIILLAIFMTDNPLSTGFWFIIGLIIYVAGLDFELVQGGMDFFRFGGFF